MILQRYMQPVAVHRVHPERLLLTDDDGRWFIWIGEPDTGPIGIPTTLASYLLTREELQPLESRQRLWFVTSDLPLRESALPSPDIAEHGSVS